MNGQKYSKRYNNILDDWVDESDDEQAVSNFSQALHSENAEEQVEFIKALNDWRPIHEYKKRKKRKRPAGQDERGGSFIYKLVRYPLLALIFIWIAILGAAYFLLRVYVAGYEHYILWTGKAYRLRKTLREADTYEKWITAATALDTFQGHDDWRTETEFDYYDFKTIRRVARRLQAAREKGSLAEIRHILETCVKSNFGGIESPRLYSMTYYGTKNLVDVYLEEVSTCMKLLLDSDTIKTQEKVMLFKNMSRNYGRTALCLSGGATLAYYHFGVVKALLDANLLPNVITGTSGGGLIAAMCCTHTDEELKLMLVPELAIRLTACHENYWIRAKRWWKSGAQFDAVDWAKRSKFFTRGSMTFKEAYELTGRILSVSVIPNDVHSPPKLINYLTAPDTVIWSAILASAAVPGILMPVPLMQKEPNGTISPYSFGNKWKDGSLRTDIPISALNLYFNVTFTVVSQTNPHIKLWFFSPRGQVGRPTAHRGGQGWRGGFIASAMEQFLKLDLVKWLRVLRDLELMPRPAGQDWSHTFLQKFEGTITLLPKTRFSDFPRILEDPSIDIMSVYLGEGQKATFPRLQFVANRFKIERLLERGRGLQLDHDRRESQGTVLSASEAEHSKSNSTRRKVNRGRSPLYVDTAGSSSSEEIALL